MAGVYGQVILRLLRLGAAGVDGGMSDALKAVIIAVGSEMLAPTQTDTNSLFVTDMLNGLGIEVAYKAVVGDDREELARSGRSRPRASPRPDSDRRARADRRRPHARGGRRSHLGLPLDEDAAIVEAIRARFAARGLAMPEVNRRQAMVPRGARVLENPRGSAPGLLIEHRRRDRRAAAGAAAGDAADDERGGHATGCARAGGRPPAAAARAAGGRPVASRGSTSGCSRCTARGCGRQPPIETTILASPGFDGTPPLDAGRRRVGRDRRARRGRRGAVGRARARCGQHRRRALEQALGTMLRARGWRIALAESCTGGLATSRLTDVAGSSDYVDRVVVVYSNDAKRDLLGVPAAMLAQHGAVSEPVVRRDGRRGAATRAARRSRVAHHRHRGPRRRVSEEKPVGMVWIAVGLADPRETRAARLPLPRRARDGEDLRGRHRPRPGAPPAASTRRGTSTGLRGR